MSTGANTDTAPSSTYKIGLAGCGKMGAAMAAAWLQSGIAARLDILDPAPLPPEIAGQAAVTGFTDEAAFAQNAAQWDILVLAIKPQILNDVCTRIGKLPDGLAVLSIAAGKTLAAICNAFGTAQPVVRAMPNTPAAIGKGITVACASKAMNAVQKETAERLLAALGSTVWSADETVMDAVTALSGSGPAYVFYLIETMAQAGQGAGLSADMAMQLARQTVIGAAALAEHEPATSAATLRENVTSPNGTTAAALCVLMDGQFQEIMTKAVRSATARSKELSE